MTGDHADLLTLAEDVQRTVPGDWNLEECLPAQPGKWSIHAPLYGPVLAGWQRGKIVVEWIVATQPKNLIPILTRLAYLETEVVELRKGKGHYSGRQT